MNVGKTVEFKHADTEECFEKSALLTESLDIAVYRNVHTVDLKTGTKLIA
jgi:hypothetical protein